MLAASRALWGSALCRVLPFFERARSSRLGSPRALDTLCPRLEPAPEEGRPTTTVCQNCSSQRNAWENVRPERCPVSSRIISPPTGKISPKQKILRKKSQGVHSLLIINSTSEMALITGEQYVQAWGAVFGVYALLMLLVPEKMVSDHFKAKCTPMNAFWIRGQSVSVAATAYLLQKIPTAEAVDFGLLITAAIAILYPYNAKFGLISKNMPVKYTGFPNHYVPEVLMTGCKSSPAHFSNNWLFPCPAESPQSRV